MITHKDDSDEDELASFVVLGLIESHIREYHPPNEDRWLKRLQQVKTQEQALNLLAELEEYKPIIGLHQWPRDLAEMKEAIRFKMDIEDFKERNK